MTTERHACGLGSLLPMSCRGRAEAFARRLQSRLQSLGRSTPGDPGDSEESWLTAQSHYPTSLQPRHSTSSDSDVYFDFDVDFESPGSPQEEATEADLQGILLNKARGGQGGESQRGCGCIPESQEAESGCATASATAASPGSDDSSDNNFYDPESFDLSPSVAAGPGANVGLPLTDDLSLLIDSTLRESCSHVQCNGFQDDDDDDERDTSNTDNNNKPDEDKAEQTWNVNGVTESHSEHVQILKSLNENDTNESIGVAEAQVNGGCKGLDEVRPEHPVTRARRPRVDYAKCNGQRSPSTPDKPVAWVAEERGSSSPVYTSEVVIPGPEGGVESFCSAVTLTPKEMVIDCTEIEEKEDAASVIPDVEVTAPARDAQQEDNIQESLTVIGTKVKIEVDSTVGTKLKVEDDEDDDRPQRVRRCSSLKTGKTPPGTPGRKKIVRFADVLGLDLADVRTFLDEIPKVPTSAYEDLQDADLSLGSSTSISSLAASIGCSLPKPDKTLVPLFVQPGGCADFFDRIREQQVCLENAIVADVMLATIVGTVRVRNLDFNKSVHIRYTLDSWKTFSDLQASYIQNSCDGFSDTFSFTLYAHTVGIGQRLEFAVRFQCHGCQYWDSNRGNNYAFQCLPPAGTVPYRSRPMSTCPDEHWASFY